MDPNAALANLRQALEIGDTVAAAQAGADLDEWLAKGGFLPKAWQPNRPTVDYQELDPEAKQVRDAAIAARGAGAIEGQTLDNRPWKILPSVLTAQELYPKTGVHTWNAWPILAVETGGYNDIEVTDPYTGRLLWVGEVWSANDNPDDSAVFANVLRRAADTIEQSGFMNAPEPPTPQVDMAKTMRDVAAEHDVVLALPKGVQPLAADEAIRRIQERDHHSPKGFLPVEIEDALIAQLRSGELIAGLTSDGELAFA